MKRILLGLFLVFPSIALADLRPSTIFLSNTLQSGATFYVSSGTAVNFNASTATITNLVGTTTNDNAAVGNFEEYISSVVSAVPFGSTTAFKDGATFSLTAGDWDVTLMGYIGPAALVTQASVGISVTTGNSPTGLVSGDNYQSELVPPTAAIATNICIANWRRSINATTPIYAKIQATYTGTVPVFYGRLSARRVR